MKVGIEKLRRILDEYMKKLERNWNQIVSIIFLLFGILLITCGMLQGLEIVLGMGNFILGLCFMVIALVVSLLKDVRQELE